MIAIAIPKMMPALIQKLSPRWRGVICYSLQADLAVSTKD
jgi:hypothetical protein